MRYRSIDELLALADGPNGEACRQLLTDHRTRFEAAPGSSTNHQAWRGGYMDHVTEIMNLYLQLYRLLERTGRLGLLPLDERFNLSDGLVVLFVHDLEKPWRYEITDDLVSWKFTVNPQLQTKPARKQFVHDLLHEYNIVLSPMQLNALTYVEGVRDDAYSAGARIIGPLGALVHCCDLLSARLFYDFPQRGNDPWLANSTDGSA